MAKTTAPPAAPGCYVISLRPAGGHGALRAAAARAGWATVAVSPWRIAPRTGPADRAALHAALQAPAVVVTSPAAVRAAAALLPLAPRRGQAWCAVGAGTVRALRRAGVDTVQSPSRMDSEGLLALPMLRDARAVGLVGAPGGRDAIAPALAARGVAVHRADVYDRVALAPSPRAVAALRAATGAPWLLPLTSEGALRQALASWPADLAARLRDARVVAASERLAGVARGLGFGDITVAGDPRPGPLLAAAGLPRG